MNFSATIARYQSRVCASVRLQTLRFRLWLAYRQFWYLAQVAAAQLIDGEAQRQLVVIGSRIRVLQGQLERIEARA